MARLGKGGSNEVGIEKLRITVRFTVDDPNALGRYVSAGVVLLQTNHPFITKIRKAFSPVDYLNRQG